jgi:hypothetical protein
MLIYICVYVCVCIILQMSKLSNEVQSLYLILRD